MFFEFSFIITESDQQWKNECSAHHGVRFDLIGERLLVGELREEELDVPLVEVRDADPVAQLALVAQANHVLPRCLCLQERSYLNRVPAHSLYKHSLFIGKIFLSFLSCMYSSITVRDEWLK